MTGGKPLQFDVAEVGEVQRAATPLPVYPTAELHQAAVKRVAHVKSHQGVGDEMTATAVKYITYGLGSPDACVRELNRHARASAIHAWFGDGKLASLRQWSFVAAMLEIDACRREQTTNTPSVMWPDVLYPLLSNDSDLIEAHLQLDTVIDRKRAKDAKLFDFFAYQVVLALRGDWDRLRYRSQRPLDSSAKFYHKTGFRLDQTFYLGLATKDAALMKTALSNLLSLKLLRTRQHVEGGFTRDLISTPAVIYSKIAWYHGFEIVVDSPFLPKEWLPMDPLPHYEIPYAFLRTRRLPGGNLGGPLKFEREPTLLRRLNPFSWLRRSPE